MAFREEVCLGEKIVKQMYLLYADPRDRLKRFAQYSY